MTTPNSLPDESIPKTQKPAAAPAVATPLPPQPRQSYGYSYSYGVTQRQRPLREYLSVVLAYRYLIVASAIIGLLIGVNIHRNQPVFFQSSALVNVGSYVPPTEGPTGQVLQFETQKQEYLDNLLPTLTSYAIARKVLSGDQEIRRYVDPGYIPQPQKEGSNLDSEAPLRESDLVKGGDNDIPVWVLDRYLTHLSTTHDQGTTLVSITAMTGDANMAARIANAHAEAFMAIVRQQRFVWANTNVEFLKKRVQEISARAKTAEDKLIAFAREHSINVNDSTRVGDNTAQKFEMLIQNLSDAVLEKTAAERDLRTKRSVVARDGYGIDDKAWNILPRLTELQTKYELARRNGANQYWLRRLDTEIQAQKNLLKKNSQAGIDQAAGQLSGAIEKERLLRSELVKLKEESSVRLEQNLEYSVLERDAKAVKEQLARLQVRLEEAIVNTESDQRTVILVDPALPPAGPYQQKEVSILLSGLLFGTMLGVGLAFFMDYQNSTVRTVSDLSVAIDAPILGIVPSFSKSMRGDKKGGSTATDIPIVRPKAKKHHHGKQGDQFQDAFDMVFLDAFDLSPNFAQEEQTLASSHDSLILVTRPYSKESEAFRNIRATIKYSSRQGPPKLLLVTSGQKGDGKSTFAVNLAASLAQTSARCIIIDADLRMPTVHTYFGRNRDAHGLSDFLIDSGKIENYMVDTEVENLSLISAGRAVSNPAEILGSRRMLALIDHLSADFDHVIIDTPPVGEIADALLLCPTVDGVIVVVRSGATLKSVAQLASTRLKQVRAKILGTVLNGLKPLDGASDGYTSRYSKYGYYGKK